MGGLFGPASPVPGLRSIATLTRAALPHEIAAGLSVAAVAVPVGLAMAKLIGVPPEVGLYASIIPTLIYALVGPSSRYLIVGPDTATCLLLGATITSLGVVVPAERAELAAGLTLLVGLGCMVAALLRLGFIANLISRPVLVGYLAGVAVTLFIHQLPSLTRVDLSSPGIARPFIELFRRGAEIHWPTPVLGVGLFVLLRVIKRLTPRVPGPLVMVVVALLLSWLLDLATRGFVTIGAVPTGLPLPRLPTLVGDPAELTLDVLGLLIVGFSSGILTARAFGQRVGATSRPNQELGGFGAADVGAGLFQGFAVTGADSRTAIALASGGQSAMVGIVAALAVALVVTFLADVLALLPVAALGAMLVSSAIDLFDLKAFFRLAKIDRAELGLALLATGGVIWMGVLPGVFIAVIATLAHLVRLAATPLDDVMGRHPLTGELVTLSRRPEAVESEAILVYLFKASILFVNAQYFQERVLEALAARPGTKWLVLDCSTMVYADSSAVEALTALKQKLEEDGIDLLLGGGHGRYRGVLERSGLLDLIGRDHRFNTPAAALAAAEAMRDAAGAGEAEAD
ncbi:MAG: SulP family inorganic anion transporter [Allosphingosinicella sp.]